ncbi:MAG: DUF6282 family protein [Candidatus Bathyarchaeota archaeon]|jgi:hypothetical protein|nr:DUF6282 family protein [Candidatus Bathyarchaeota archaeon]
MTFSLPRSDLEHLDQVCDLHLHAVPSIFERPYDDIELARHMRDVGYRAMVVKCHHADTASRAQLVRKVVKGIEVFGGIVLNHAVGGLNPEAVDAAIGFGAKEIWMPTLHAANHISVIGMAGYPQHQRLITIQRRSPTVEGISIFTGNGELRPEIDEILALIADANVILGTSHLSIEEDYALVTAAQKMGVKKILITHPGWTATDWTLDEQVKLAKMGAMMEYCYGACMPFEARLDPQRIVDGIHKIGVEKCIMATDLGQTHNPHPVDGMRQFIRLMLKLGISERDIGIMTRENPARLLGL